MSDYYLVLEPITMYTAGGGVVHPHSEVYATEHVTCAVPVVNPAPEASGQLSVSWSLDGSELWTELVDGIGTFETKSLLWHDYMAIPEGDHVVGVVVTPIDPRAVHEGLPQQLHFKVIPHDHHRAMEEGQEARQHGWTAADVHVRIEDCFGKQVHGGEAVIQFSGHGGESSGERGQLEDGLVTFDQVYAPVKGELRVWVTLPAGPVPQLYGTADVDVVDAVVRVAFTQDKDREQISHAEALAKATKWGGKVSAGVEGTIFLIKAHGNTEASYEHLRQTTDTDTATYELWIPKGSMHSRVDAVPSQR